MDRKAILALIGILAHDRKLARAFADVLVEATRPEKPPEGTFPARELPGVAADPRSISEARQRLAALREERQQILRRKSLWQTNASEDRRVDDLVAEIEVTSRRIEMAERMINGGQNG